MNPRPAASGLRAARRSRGWSQARTAREVAALGRSLGVPVASAASLTTLLSRWENGHVVPDPQYRTLLGQLYDRTPRELGIAGPVPDPPDPDPADGGPGRLLTAIAVAAAADRAGPELWWEQLAGAARLDDELGAAAAGGMVGALVEQLEETHVHAVDPAGRVRVAGVLAAAAALAGAQELDRGAHDLAWRRFHRSRTAAAEAGLPGTTAVALAGQADVLVDAGDAAAAIALLDGASEATGAARVRLDAARALARAAAGEERAARGALAAAGQGWGGEPPDREPPDREPPDREPPDRETRPTAPDGPPITRADLHRWQGRALVVLGDPGAAHPLRRALDAVPRSVRDRAAVHADLALALRTAHPDEAAGHARTARQLAVSIGSTRIAARLAEPPT